MPSLGFSGGVNFECSKPELLTRTPGDPASAAAVWPLFYQIKQFLEFAQSQHDIKLCVFNEIVQLANGFV
jgi:hypothetical protein